MENDTDMLTDKMIRKANQIASFFQAYPEQKAIEGVAEHLNKFWTLDMRAQLADYISTKGDGLNDLVIKASQSLNT
jgi:formate dehydrogenase subunit delta